jgi:hypothetical protein
VGGAAGVKKVAARDSFAVPGVRPHIVPLEAGGGVRASANKEKPGSVVDVDVAAGADNKPGGAPMACDGCTAATGGTIGALLTGSSANCTFDVCCFWRASRSASISRASSSCVFRAFVDVEVRD